jgi:hypothetical protein
VPATVLVTVKSYTADWFAPIGLGVAASTFFATVTAAVEVGTVAQVAFVAGQVVGGVVQTVSVAVQPLGGLVVFWVAKLKMLVVPAASGLAVVNVSLSTCGVPATIGLVTVIVHSVPAAAGKAQSVVPLLMLVNVVCCGTTSKNW